MTPVSAAQVRRGLAEYLAERDVAEWSPDTPYSPTDRAIALRRLPTSPDEAVAIEVYDTTDDVILPDVELMVQLRFRANGDAVDDFADAAFAVLHGRHMFSAGTVKVQSCRRVSSAPMGPDENGRDERVDNYSLVLMRG